MSTNRSSSYLFLYLLIAGVSFLFLPLLGALTYLFFQSDVGSINFPFWFLGTSLFIIMISYFAERAKLNFKEGNILFGKAWQFTLLSVLLFFIGQLLSWNSIWSQEALMTTNNSYAFTYLLSGLHLLHVLAALPILIWFHYQFKFAKKDEMKLNVFFADQSKFIKLDQTIIYLHFMGVLWFLLLVVFSLMALI